MDKSEAPHPSFADILLLPQGVLTKRSNVKMDYNVDLLRTCFTLGFFEQIIHIHK